MRDRRAAVAIALGLVALVLGVFGQTRGFEFVNLDDGVYVARNADLDLPLDRSRLVAVFTEPFLANWAPVTLLSFRLDHALHGREPGAYHVTNVLLHALASLLLFEALRRATGSLAAPAFVAAVFAIHPLHVETVAWVSERKGVLAGLFWMAGLAAWVRYAERPGLARYALALGCLVLGLLSKPVLVTFPLALLLFDHWPLRRLSWRAVWEKAPMLPLVAASSALTLWAQRAGGAMSFAETRAIPLGWRVANAIDACAQYLRESVWPAGLSVFHPHALGTLATGRVLAEAALLAAISFAALAQWRRRPWLAVGWLWFLGTLFPTLGLVQVGSQARADRYTYVPQVGLCIALAFSVADATRLSPRAGRAAAAAGLLAVLALAGAAWVQTGTWRDSERLYERNLALEPESHQAHGGLALVRIEQERFEEAEAHLREQYRLRPELGRDRLRDFHVLMGSRAAERGEAAAAIARYEQAVALDPGSAVANGVLGAALVRQGQHQRARAHLERALAKEDAPAIAYAAMAVIEADAGREAEAVRLGREALRRDPRLDWAANNLAWILATSSDPSLRDPAEAVRLAEGVVARSDPPDANYLDTLATAYAAAGRSEDARATGERAAAALAHPSR